MLVWIWFQVEGATWENIHVVATCRGCYGVMFVHLNLAPLTSETFSLRELNCDFHGWRMSP